MRYLSVRRKDRAAASARTSQPAIMPEPPRGAAIGNSRLPVKLRSAMSPAKSVEPTNISRAAAINTLDAGAGQ